MLSNKIQIKNKTPLESTEQINFFLWVNHNYPDLIIFSIPNGGTRHKQEAIKLKREGVLPGVSDIFCPELKLFIEMKRVKGGTVSKEQKFFLDSMNHLGYTAKVAKGFEEAKKIMLDIMTSIDNNSNTPTGE